MAGSNNLFINVQGNADNLRHSLRGVGNDLGNLNRTSSRTTGSMAQGFKNLNRLINLGVMYKLANQLAYAIKGAMDMIETVNLFNVALGDMSVQANKTALALSETFGMDITNLQSAIGGYALLARSMGMSSEQAQILSTNTSKLAIDLSSLTNVPVQQVLQDLKSGLVGQSETVYKYGMDVTEAGLKTEAMNQGITASVRDMNQGEKMALRYSAMIRQSGLAQGDFARTINQPANQLKILTERMTTLGRSIGSIFMPMIGAVLPYLNALVSMLILASNAIASFFGYEPPKIANTINNAVGGISDDVGGIAGGLDDATGSAKDTTKALKEMKNATMGFDELNILPSPSATADPVAPKGAGAGAGGGLGGAGMLDGFEMPSYDNMMKGVKSISGDIQKELTKIWKGFVKLSEPLIFANWGILRDSIARLGEALGGLAGTIGEGLAYFYEHVLVPVGVWFIEKGVPAVVDVLTSAFDALNDILEALAPSGAYFLDNLLMPLLDFLGGGILLGLDLLRMAFVGLGNWFTDNSETINGVLIGMMKPLVKIGDWIKDHKTFVEDFTLVIGSFALAWGILTVAFGLWDIIAGITTVTTGLLAGVMGFLFSPITVIVAVLGTLIAVGILLYKHWDEISAFASKVWKGIAKYITDAFSGIGAWFKKVFDDAWNGVKSAWSSTGSFFGGVWGKIKSAFSSTNSWFSSTFQSAWSGVKNAFAISVVWFYELWGKIKSVFSSVGSWFGNTFQGAWNSIVSVFSNTVNWFGSTFRSAWNSITSAFSNVYGWFSSTFSGAWSGMSSAFSNVYGYFSGVWSTIRSIFSGVGSWFYSLFTGAWNYIGFAFSSGLSDVRWYFTDLWISASNTVSKIISFFSNMRITIPHIKMPHIYMYGSFSLSPPRVPKIGVNWYQNGGVFDKATQIGVGENGAEAVMPLEKNTGWIDILASKLNSKGGNVAQTTNSNDNDRPLELILQVGSTEFGRVVIDSINKITKQEGRLALNI